jgi:hypothetical protein
MIIPNRGGKTVGNLSYFRLRLTKIPASDTIINLRHQGGRSYLLTLCRDTWCSKTNVFRSLA